MSGDQAWGPAHNGRVPAALARAAVGALCLMAACGGGPSPPGPPGPVAGRASTAAVAPSTTGPPPAGSVTVVAAGDIACLPGQAPSESACRMRDTADVVEAAAPAAVLTLGDNQYEVGALDGFKESYDRSWGRFKAITRPSVGNHEYSTPRAAGYFAYFGAAAGPEGQGWYSFDLGAWHLVALNSNCSVIGGCGPGSEQFEWLEDDLAASGARCTLAYWHHPRFTSGYHGDDATVGPLWDLLHAASAEVVLAGHDHHYERFAPLAPDGTPSPGGIRQFIVGTGGRSLFPTLLPHAGSEVRRAATFGVLVLTLTPDGYRWRFAPAPGDDFTDTGQGACH